MHDIAAASISAQFKEQPMDYDTDKVDDVTLALLYLVLPAKNSARRPGRALTGRR